MDSSQRDRSRLLQKICVTESRNCFILLLHLLTPLTKALKNNQHFLLGRKSSSAISKRSFGFEEQLSNLSSLQTSSEKLCILILDWVRFLILMQNVEGQGRGGASYKNRQPSPKVLPLKLKHTGTHSLLLEDHHEDFFSCSAG